MDLKELRLGNYIYESPNITDVVETDVIKINKSDLVSILESDEHIFETHYHPIALTEEWLLKFGFTINGDSKFLKDGSFSDDFSYTLDNGLSNREFVCYPYNGWYVEIGQYAQIGEKLKIKFVHHLQNLYFDMTEKELKIKL